MNPRISIVGLLTANKGLFDDMVLPEGVNKTRVIDNIVEDCYELEVLFPDPNYMQYAIKSWSERRLYSWQKLYDTTNLIYNPIWNKDGTVTETETGTNAGTETGTVADSGESSGSGTNAHSARGFNASALVQTESDQNSYSNSADNTTTKNLATSGEHEISRTRRETGNIGVTSTQSMIEEERKVAKFDIYQIIADDFKTRFTIMVY